MVDRPFKIRLRRSKNSVGDSSGMRGDARQIVVEFPLTQSSHVSQMSRRSRIFAALVGLDSKQRTSVSRAASEAARVFNEATMPAVVQFGIRNQYGNSIAEVQVAATEPDAPRAFTSDRLAKLLELAEPLHCKIAESPPMISIGVSIPHSVRLSRNDVANWAELLQAPTSDDAIVIAQHARQQPNNEFGIARSYGLSEAATGQAAADREDLETLSLVANQSPIAILVMDAHGRIQWANPAFGKLTGYSEGEVIGRRVDQLLFGPSTDQKAVRNCEQALRNGYELSNDVLQYHRNGRTIWVELRLIPIHDDCGKLARWIGIETDITVRHQSEEALRVAKQSAEMSNRAKGEFLANMSHEIRTPLNAIVGMTELALTTELNSEQRDYLNCVQSSADTLLGLLNDVLDVSKIEAGKMEIESITFNLGELVRDTLRALAVKAHEKGLELDVHMSMDIPQYMEGDPIRIRQVLYNLVGNAIKFTERGEVVVEVEEQWTTDDETCLHFVVRDTGIGIPKDRLQQIFEAFTQVDSSMARRFGGTGLGLTITSELIRMMGGRIWVQSSLGEGSTFHFTIHLRLADPPESAPLAIDADELVGKRVKRRVLVVDDHEPNRKLAIRMLQRRGHECDSATDGDEAIAAVSRKSYDVVLMDVQMPGSDGFVATERIRQNEKATGSHLPIVALTAHALTGDREKCLAAGMDEYLAKPIHANELIAMVERITSEATGHSTVANPPPYRNGDVKPFDISEALQRMNGETDLLIEHIGFVVSDAPQLIEKMREAIASSDAGSLTIAAHRLKSLVGAYSHDEAHELSYSLELMGKQDNLDDAEATIDRLEQLVTQFVRAIEAYAMSESGS